MTAAPKRPNSQPRPWEQQGDEEPISFGAWLRRQREARDIGLQEIAASSKIGIRILEAFEQDRFDRLPAPVFVRGFLREYAKYVGLNPDDVVNFFLSAQGKAAQPADDAPTAAAKPVRVQRRKELAYVLSVAALLAVLLGVAAFLAWFVQRRQAAVTGTASPAASAAAPEGSRPAPGPQPSRPASPVPATAGEAQAPLRVQLDFTQDCWVEREIDGGQRLSELRVAGESLILQAQRSILLSLGNVAGAALTVNGKPYPMPQAGKVLRDLLLEAPPAAPSPGEPARAPGAAANP